MNEESPGFLSLSKSDRSTFGHLLDKFEALTYEKVSWPIVQHGTSISKDNQPFWIKRIPSTQYATRINIDVLFFWKDDKTRFYVYFQECIGIRRKDTHFMWESKHKIFCYANMFSPLKEERFWELRNILGHQHCAILAAKSSAIILQSVANYNLQ